MNDEKRKSVELPTVTHHLADGRLVELVYSVAPRKTLLAVSDNNGIEITERLALESGESLVPVSATTNLISHGAVLLAEHPEAYGNPADLVADIRKYLHSYVDLSPRFQTLAAYYALLTWVYDAFQELPYIRFRGDFGSGKTRALRVLGSICNKPFFASGASSVSPIFHVLNSFRGTLLFDEADFRFSDEKSELVKILNNGMAMGFPVLRSASSATRDFEPRAFQVYGPKIVAMRRSYDDQALESRFLTEEMGQRPLRAGIPLNLPKSQEREARTLRNKLLNYRFEHFHKVRLMDAYADPTLSPRINQILLPLLSLIPDEAVREEIKSAVRKTEGKLYATRAASIEGLLLEVVAKLLAESPRPQVPISDIAAGFAAAHGGEVDRPVSSRFVSGILRDRLHLSTYKSHGVYVLSKTESSKVSELCRRYGVSVDAVTEVA
jgi:hypothetical protein